MTTSTIVEEFVRRQGQQHFYNIKCNLLDKQGFESKVEYCTTLAMFWARALQNVAIAMQDDAASDLEYNDLAAAEGLFEETAYNAKFAAEQLGMEIEVTKEASEYVVSLMKEIIKELELQDIAPRLTGQYKLRVMTQIVKLHICFIADFIDRYRQKLEFAEGKARDEDEIKSCNQFINVLKYCFSGFMEMEYQLIQ
ncbi:MAG: hypothetical protein AB8E87_10000 [Prochlorococcus sp.]|nr:hypothetical protein [Prochlorococcaceae cyanobacterium Fu_MAG_50]